MKRPLPVIVLLLMSTGLVTVMLWRLRNAPEPAADTGLTELSTDSHQRMLAALEDVRQRSLEEDPYFSRQPLEVELQKLKELEIFKDFADPGTAPRRFELHHSVSQHYRRLGQLDFAIEHLLEAERIQAEFGLRLPAEVAERYLYETGLTYLRKGETENCLHCVTGESCILPITGAGIHSQREGSRIAMAYFERIVRANPEHLRAVWLLNIAAMTLGEFPENVPEPFRLPPERFRAVSEFPRFHEIGRDVGVRTISCGGAGIADDFDNDGLIDLFAGTWAPDEQVYLHRNTGRGDFTREAAGIGLEGILGGINGVQADFDNDGHLDLFLVRGAWLGAQGRHPNSLLRNLGGGTFRDVTFELGLGEAHFPSSCAAWADFDNDGDLDLFVGNEGFPCQLFRNDGAEGFVDVAEMAGVTNDRHTKGATWGDFNGNGLPDLYVSNLKGENRLYRNNGDGTFTDVAPELNVHLPFHSFPTWFWDVNNDGELDLFVGSYNAGTEHLAAEYTGRARLDETSKLYLNDGQGGFRDVSQEYGLNRTTQPMGCNFGDLDNDGFLDFYLGTGYPELGGVMPNLMFRNVNGERFEDVSLAGGFAHLQKGHATAFADFDNDGDQDIFMQMGGAYPADAFGNVLYENPGFGNHWVRVKLEGVTSNYSAIGARIRANLIEHGRPRSIYRWVNSGGSFGGNPLQQQIGLGQATRIESLEIDWPASGTRQIFQDLPVDRLIEITEHDDTYRSSVPPSFRFKQPPR
jgi:hypothetical protein